MLQDARRGEKRSAIRRLVRRFTVDGANRLSTLYGMQMLQDARRADKRSAIRRRGSHQGLSPIITCIVSSSGMPWCC
jgi:hypothetical protein